MTKKITAITLLLALGSSSLLTSCETGVGTGALVGAGLGAAIGNTTQGGGGTRTAQGAAIGALAGALAGAVYDENKREKNEARYYEDDVAYRGRSSYRGERSYPYGEPTRYSGYVRSPYRPFNIIDVRGIPDGALVVDPSTDRPFRNP